MRSFPRATSTRLPHAASRHDPATVSPAALRIAQEADATMSPDSWGTANYQPELLAAVPVPSPVLSPVKVVPAA